MSQVQSKPAKVGVPYKSFKEEGPYDAIVIGSGIGGLTTAALLAKHAGKRVLILERHYTAGGYTHVFKRPGFEWDIGVHYIGEVMRPRSMLRILFDELSDGRLQWAPMDDVYDRIVIDNQAFDFVAGTERFKESLKVHFPNEASAIDRYIDLVNACAKSSRGYFAEKAIPSFAARFAGPFMRRGFLKFARQTTLEVLRGITSNPMLIGVLTGQWGDYGLTPAQSSFAMHAILVRHYLGGGAYPVGGSAEIAASIVPTIQQAGGEVLINAEVQEILLKGNAAVGVRMKDGRELRAEQVVSGCGYFNTFERLLPTGTVSPGLLKYRRTKVEPSLSHMNLYVGLNASDEALGLPKCNYWIYPTPDHDTNIAHYVADPEQPLPIVYLSFPSAKDPSFAERYPGKSTVQAISLAPYDWFAKWADKRWHNRGKDYDAFKETLTQRLRDEMIRWVPQVKDHIEHCELSTPISTQHFMNYSRGEPYGLAHTPTRFEQRWLRPQTSVKNLFLTGQDIATAGVGGALIGGVLTASSMLKRNLLSAIGPKAKAQASTASRR